MDYNEIVAKVESLKAKKSRAEGRLERQAAELKEKFGFKSLEEASKGLKKLQSQRDETREKLDAALAEFEEKWGGRL